ncbi:MAG: glycosyltransferase family 2 protein, partial [Pirellulales bacterium]
MNICRFFAREPRVAMVMSVRNEARFLAAHLSYHRALGIERAYIFLDRCTDGTDQIAASFPWVRTIRLDPNDACRFRYVGDWQTLCMDRALAHARDDGIDWLLAIDPDEFAIGGRPRRLFDRKSIDEPCDLPTMLACVPRSTKVVKLLPKETIPLDIDPSEPFWRQKYFLQDRDFRRDILNPSDGSIINNRGYVGHMIGKVIVRTSANIQAWTAHGWARFQNVKYPHRPGACGLKMTHLGRLLHYVIVDWRQWKDKHFKLSHEPVKWHTGKPVGSVKQCWKEAATRLNDEQARQYYREWVAMPEARLQELEEQGIVQRHDDLERVLRAAGTLDGDRVVTPSGGNGVVEDWRLPADFWPDDETLSGMSRGDNGSLTIRMSQLQPEFIDGFHSQEYDGRNGFMWTSPDAQLQFTLSPGYYRMTLKLTHAKHWRGGGQISIDGHVLPRSDWIAGKKQISVDVRPDHFAAQEEHQLRLQFPIVNSRRWRPPDYRELGIAVVKVTFELHCEERRAAA